MAALQPVAAVRRRHRDIAKARRRMSLRAVLKMCDQVEGQYRIRPAHPAIVRFPVERSLGVLEELRSAVAQYRQTLEADRREVLRRYYFGDSARKVVGVGSVGTEAFVMLLIGDRADEPLSLQVKEVQEQVLAPFASPGEYQHQGERVVMGQRLTQERPVDGPASARLLRQALRLGARPSVRPDRAGNHDRPATWA